MGKEIERKFLVTGDDWNRMEYSNYVQGYLSVDKERTVRVRITDEHAVLTVKGITRHATREEYEYPIPVNDAANMLRELCLRPLIVKRRYRINHSGMTWEVDEFQGENAGLVVAEIELDDEQQEFEKPDWIGEEITTDQRYYNANLVASPFSSWHR
jgi:CYTH domain-containing protein